jgi:3-deoxy-D-arabino-heptulosonate 7-phosphate (DAHP) synthase
MARAAVAAGADGIMVEVHDHPERALSDGPQSIYPAQFATMMDELEQMAPIVARTLPRGIHIQAAAD